MKKTYIYTKEVSKCKKVKLHYNVEMKIYKVEDNKPTLICQHAYNSASCKGEESECLTRLHFQNIVSDAEYNLFNGHYVHGRNSILIYGV